MSSTPRSAGGSVTLTQPISRASRSPRTPSSNAPASGGGAPAVPAYMSFPLADKAAAAHARSNSLDAADISKAKAAPADRRSLTCTWLAFVISSPALLGMCCWPSLVAGVVGGSVSAGSRALSHTVSLAVTASVLACMLAYFAYATRQRAQLHSTHLAIYGPLYLLTLASALVLADPLRHVLQDGGQWPSPSSDGFKEGCGEGWKCLTPVGWLFMGAATWGGFALLFTASAWNGNLLAKINLCQREWSAIRQAHAAAELERTKQARVEAEQAREEAVRARQAAIASSLSPSSAGGAGGFNKLHLAMTPPTFVYRAEQTNARARVGHLLAASGSPMPGFESPLSPTNQTARRGNSEQEEQPQQQPQPSQSVTPGSSSPVATLGGGSATPADSSYHAAEGFSFEVKTPFVNENIIKVSPSSSNSHSGGGGAASSRGVHVHGTGGLSPTVQNTPSVSGSHLSVDKFLYPSASPMSTTSFADVALTPANGDKADGSFGSPTSSSSTTPAAQRYKHSPHTPGQLEFHGAYTGISPRTGSSVRQHFEELQQASSPFNKDKYRQQQAEEAKQRAAAANAAIHAAADSK